MLKPQGGTELLHRNLLKNVTGWQDKVNLIVSICDKRFIDPEKLNYVWQHLHTDQPNVSGMSDKEFLTSVDKFIYVSEFQKNEFKRCFVHDEDKSIVIRNAINPIPFIKKPTDKIRLIYTSMPNRGLDILLDALDLLKLKDIEVLIYSSNVIYGSSYAQFADSSVIDRCKASKFVTYKGYATNQAIRASLQSAHILAYPSTYVETSCLAAIEAGAAGCSIITTDLGALPETCGTFAHYCEYTPNRDSLVNRYAGLLKAAIDGYSDCNSEKTSNHFNNMYSWENRKLEWQKLLNE